MKKLFLFLFMFFGFGFLEVYADYQSEYNFLNDYVSFEQYFNDESNLFNEEYSVLDYLNYVEKFITKNNINGYDYSIYFVSGYDKRPEIFVYIFKEKESIPVSIFLQNNTLMVIPDVSSTNGSFSTFSFKSGSSFLNEQYDKLLDCLTNGTNYTSNITYQMGGTYSYTEPNIYFSDEINNISIPYKSTFANSFYLKDQSGSSIRYSRDLVVKGQVIKFNDFIPTYFDIIGESSYLPYLNFYGIFGKLENYESDLVDFSFSSNYDLSNISVNNINFFTKVINGNYITYKKISCTYNLSNSINDNVLSYQIDNFVCSDVDDSVYFNLTLNNTSYIHSFKNNNSKVDIYVNDVVNDSNYIVDTLYFLSSNSQILFTSDLSVTNFYYFHDKNYSYFSRIVDLNSLSASFSTGYGVSLTSKLKPYFSGDFGKSTNTGVIVYNSNLNQFNLSFSYVVNANSILLSVSNDNNYYYINNNGEIVNSIIINDYFGSSNVSVESDVSNYFDYIVIYLDDINDSVLIFKNQIQIFFNSAPLEIRNIIIIIFVCCLTYITFKILTK